MSRQCRDSPEGAAMGWQSRPQNGLRCRMRTAAPIAVLVLVLSGCAAASGGTAVSDNPSTGSIASSETSGAGTSAPRPAEVTSAAADGPSAAALMVCGDETRANIMQTLSLPADPPTTSSWAEKLYTCTYTLPAGSLVLSVKEAPDARAARDDLAALQRAADGAAPIEGLENLGFPAFQTPASAVFAKDNFVLTVDAAALPDALGPHNVSRDAFAYQVATAVLACWSE